MRKIYADFMTLRIIDIPEDADISCENIDKIVKEYAENNNINYDDVDWNIIEED